MFCLELSTLEFRSLVQEDITTNNEIVNKMNFIFSYEEIKIIVSNLKNIPTPLNYVYDKLKKNKKFLIW